MKKNKQPDHPWGVFLEARKNAIFFLKQNGNSEIDIAQTLSMTETQVYQIIQHAKKFKTHEN